MGEKDLKLTEAQLKRQIGDYLEYGTNQGRWYASRLNSGIAYVKRGDKYYAITLCREGTADFMVMRAIYFEPKPRAVIPKTKSCRVIFLELKGDKGKTSPAQNAFKILVEAQGCSYFVIRSIEELENVLA